MAFISDLENAPILTRGTDSKENPKTHSNASFFV